MSDIDSLHRSEARGQAAATTQEDVAVLAVDAGTRVQRNAAKVGGVAIAVGPQRDISTHALQARVAGLGDLASGFDQQGRIRQTAADIGIQLDVAAIDADRARNTEWRSHCDRCRVARATQCQSSQGVGKAVHIAVERI